MYSTSGALSDTAAPTGQAVRERGITGSELPVRGALAVTVPGAAALWEDTVKAFGKLPLAEVRTSAGCHGRRPAGGLAFCRDLLCVTFPAPACHTHAVWHQSA